MTKVYLVYNTEFQSSIINIPFGCFKTREEAENAAKGRGFWGSKGIVVEMYCYDSFEEYRTLFK